MSRQRRIGLTGGIASGKSSVGQWLRGRGLPVLDADQYAREALAPGEAASHSVVRRYGDEVITTGSDPKRAEIDRSALAYKVFKDTSERQWLERLIHPLVQQRFHTRLEELKGEPTLVLMIPLLFEAGLEELCTEVWVVHCSMDQQKERLMARNHIEAEEADRRIQAQFSLEKKCLLADQVINNSKTEGEWQQQVASLI